MTKVGVVSSPAPYVGQVRYRKGIVWLTKIDGQFRIFRSARWKEVYEEGVGWVFKNFASHVPKN